MASSTHASVTNNRALNAVNGPAISAAPAGSQLHRRRSVWRQLARHRLALIGLSVLVLFVLLSILAPVLSPYEPDRTSLLERFQPPNAKHWLGADELGRDIYTRLMYGARVSLAVGFLVAVLGVAVGALVGAISAYAGGRVDEAVMRVV